MAKGPWNQRMIRLGGRFNGGDKVAAGVEGVLPGETATARAAHASLAGERRGLGRLLPFLGPAFIACVAYVDPGNFATNVSGGAQFGYLLLWVVLTANLSGTDHLTDLPNRREGEDRLANDIARARHGGGHLTVAVVDLDDFKTINDTHGHHAGDVCIRHVADVIGRSVREGDWLCRWGGDEFVLALWDESVFASPEAVLGRINAELRRSPVRLSGGEELVLSISVGAHRYAGEDDLRELLAKADGAMYQAKREGRAWVLAD